MPSIKRMDTDENRRFWESAERAAQEVKAWPSWKRWENQPAAVAQTDPLLCGAHGMNDTAKRGQRHD